MQLFDRIFNLALYATERVLCVFNGGRLYLDALQAGTPMLRDKWIDLLLFSLFNRFL
jgi:hypothetical protein